MIARRAGFGLLFFFHKGIGLSNKLQLHFCRRNIQRTGNLKVQVSAPDSLIFRRGVTWARVFCCLGM
jgi:hypothetical protein